MPYIAELYSIYNIFKNNIGSQQQKKMRRNLSMIQGSQQINQESSQQMVRKRCKNEYSRSQKIGRFQTKLKQRRKERTRVKSEYWDYEQIQRIFLLHSENGSQWKSMESLFVDRTANSIKNRFYTVIRTFLKILFRLHPSIIDKLPHEIPSKTVLKFYEARNEFAKFGSFAKEAMKKIDYNLESLLLAKIVQENLPEILEIYNIVFNFKEEEIDQYAGEGSREVALNPKSPNFIFGNYHQHQMHKLYQGINFENFQQSHPLDFFGQIDQSCIPQNQFLGYVMFIPVANTCIERQLNQFQGFL